MDHLHKGLLIAALSLLPQSAANAQVPSPDNRTRDTAAPAQIVIAELRAENTTLSAQVDTLRDELKGHRVQEDFYGNALDEQATRFSLIVGGLLALAALVTWRGFTFEVSRLRKQFDEAISAQVARHESFETRFRDAEARNLRESANVHRLIANSLSQSGSYTSAFCHSILSLDAVHDRYSLKPAPHQTANLINALEFSHHLLRDVRLAGEPTTEIVEDFDRITTTLKKLIASEHESVWRAATELRKEISELLAQAPAAPRPVSNDGPEG